MPENKHLKFLLIMAYLGIAYFVFVKLGSQIWNLISPFFWAFLMATVTTPLVKLLKRRLKFPNWLATGFSLISIWAIVIGALYLIMNKIVLRLIQFFSQMPIIINKVSMTLKVINIKWSKFTQGLNPEWSQYVNQAISKVNTMLISLIEPAADFTMNSVSSIATSLPSAFAFAIAFILSCLFMTSDYDRIKGFIMSQFSPKTADRIREIKKYTIIALKKYLRGMGILLMITFCELFLGLSILGVKYSFSIALLTAMLDILPVFGTGTVLIPWALISLLSGDYKFAIGIAVIYGVVTVIRQFLEPKVMSKSLGTYPIVTLMSLYIGLKVFGVFGMILGPILSLVLIYLQNSGVIHLWKPLKRNTEEKLPLKKVNKNSDNNGRPNTNK